MTRLKLMVGVLVLLLPVNASRADQILGTYHVKTLFSEPGTAGVYFEEPLPQCQFGLMYVDLGTTEGKARLALLTSARMGGWPVVRLDYSRDAVTTKCVLFGVHVG